MLGRFTHTLRFRLIVDFGVAILIPSLIILVAGIKLIDEHILRQAQSEVVSHLKSAREIYNHHLYRTESVVRLTAERFFLRDALEHGDRDAPAAELVRVLRDENLAILTVTDAKGDVFYRARNPETHGDSQVDNAVVARVIESHRLVPGTEIMDRKELLKESPELAEQADMDFIFTPKAKYRPETKETAGMMLMAGAPILSREGAFIGVLYGGTLLNRNYEIVDEIKETVFGNRSYQGREVGTATIFQHDLRISTNVKKEDGSRAIGTRVSEEVNDAVLERGENWIDEAFVVNDWYITAYEPIRDLTGRIIGMLYVGSLKKPFTDLLINTLFIFLGVALIGIALVVFASLRFTRYIVSPLRQLAEAAGKIADGDYNQHVEVSTKDEVGRLVNAVNRMTVKLAQSREELENWARTLEGKVERRTAKIQEMQQQLIQSEKLASLGKLAAGVAHEINNPLTGILTNSSLLLDDLPPSDERREDLQTIVNETIRCRKIVKALLDFARQTRPEKKPVSVNTIVASTLRLLQNQLHLSNVTAHTYLDPNIPDIMLDVDQIQQVFMNIAINAIEAMPRGGELTFRSRFDETRAAAVVTIADTGPGIPKEMLDKIFDPFFSTKESGTGLGLAITYGIVQRHDGDITVKSEPGQGSQFSVILPVKAGTEQDVDDPDTGD